MHSSVAPYLQLPQHSSFSHSPSTAPSHLFFRRSPSTAPSTSILLISTMETNFPVSAFGGCWASPKSTVTYPHKVPKVTNVPQISNDCFTLETDGLDILRCSFIDSNGNTRYKTTTNESRTSLYLNSKLIAIAERYANGSIMITSKDLTKREEDLLPFDPEGYEPLFTCPRFLNLTVGQRRTGNHDLR